MTVNEEPKSQSVVARLWPPRRMHYVILGAVVVAVAVVIAAFVLIDNLTRVAVPDLVGQGPTEAITAISDAGLAYEPFEAASDAVCTTDPPLSDHCEVTGQSAAPESRIRPGTTLKLSIELIEVAIPDFTGLTYDDAAALAKQSFIQVKPDSDVISKITGFGEWNVLAQEREPNEVVEADTLIELSLDAPLVDVPRVIGMPFGEAVEALEAVGITAGYSSVPGSTSDARLFVRAASPAPSEGKRPVGSTVTLDWGYKVPKVVGLTEGEAVRTLEEAGYSVDGYEYGSKLVSKQNPAAGTIADNSKPIELALAPPTVVYEVVSDGSRATITWIAPGTYNISQAVDASLPWKKTFETDRSPENFNAQIMNGSKVTCNIYVNGELLRTNTSTGQYSIVSCG
ncbi:MmpS family transport accessory protein [Microbacterium sp. Mu-80]|uniref:MmpS family transport accessory protein n=1 Tax=Microbacterium bandirmense TaxID=3122050 RepID=A0ABU8LEF7_9MICO